LKIEMKLAKVCLRDAEVVKNGSGSVESRDEVDQSLFCGSCRCDFARFVIKLAQLKVFHLSIH
jgi:hypothetical protein